MAEAADALGITEDAVRSGVKRGTIDHQRKGGRVYVLLDDESRSGHDQDTDQDARETEDRTAELIVTLREQLQAERQAHAEARRLLMAALERIPPQLEAPSDERQSPQTVEEESKREPHSDAPGAPDAVQRPWWRRVFGRGR